MNLSEEPRAGALAATRQTWKAKSIRDLLAELIKANPAAGNRVLLAKFIERLREDDDYFLAAAEYAFDNAMRAFHKKQKRRPAAKQTAKSAAVHAKLVAQIKGRVLLKLKMPNGKELRNCTGDECNHFGGWFKRIAARIGPDNRVGDVLSEAEVRTIYTEETSS